MIAERPEWPGVPGYPSNFSQDGAHQLIFLGKPVTWLWLTSALCWIDHVGRRVLPKEIAQTRFTSYVGPLYGTASEAVRAERASILEAVKAAGDLREGASPQFDAGLHTMQLRIEADIRARGEA